MNMNYQTKNSDRVSLLRGTLGQFPTGVAIVTTVAENNQPVGMTVNSFNSVSLTPALVSWCIDHRAVSYETFVTARNFTITLLAENQAELAMRFATRGANKFRDIESGRNSAPVIPNGCAWFKCEAYRSILLGDHTMLVGEIIEFAQYPIQPLVFKGGQFQPLQPDRDVGNQVAA
jgi:flavin reductase (DIM6/NTAB) family NADH-FMN oxidoreductase RutF